MNTEPTIRYSDEWLDWAEADGPNGYKWSAPYLRKIAFEHRARAWSIAGTILNLGLQNYIHYAVQDAVNDLIFSEYGETYAEAKARQYREIENAKRDIRLQAAMAQIRKDKENANG